jgi:hypothetical protein
MQAITAAGHAALRVSQGGYCGVPNTGSHECTQSPDAKLHDLEAARLKLRNPP